MMRKAAVLTGVPALVVLIIAGAYSTTRDFHRLRANEALQQQSAALHNEIVGVELDLADIEAGQRGYLLTGNPSYLERYNQAKSQLPAHFSGLHTGLAEKSQHERALESQLEELTRSKLAEAEESIHLRQQGYRKRAFGIVDSNRGKQWMDDARVRISELIAAEAERSSQYQQQTNADTEGAVKEIVGSSAIFLVLATLLFGMLWLHLRSLEGAVARSNEVLRARSAQLESLAHTVSQQLPELLRQVRDSASEFLSRFVDYLPAVGQTHAAEMLEMAERSNRLINDSLERSADSLKRSVGKAA